jgi:SNF2 family DNA or RNA helicase
VGKSNAGDGTGTPADAPDALGLTPGGFVVCQRSEGTLHAAFEKGEAAGLMALAGIGPSSGADASELFWKSVLDEFLRRLCQCAGEVDIPEPGDADLAGWVLNCPPMRGAEYLTKDVLLGIWRRLTAWTAAEIEAGGGMGAFLKTHAPAWSRVGRVTLHLAENRKDPDCPFAFMASYASGVSNAGRLSQLPLARAMAEYSGSSNKAALLKLLTPIHKASQSCELMASLVKSGDIFHPLAWTPEEAYAFLRSVPAYEEAGLVVRLPNWWQKKGVRPKVRATIGQKARIGVDALLDFQLDVEVDGQRLTRKEIQELLAGQDGLVLFRGQWIEVDRAKLQQALQHWEQLRGEGGISFIEGMRLLAGAPTDLKQEGDLEEHREWAFAQAGDTMAEWLAQMTAPGTLPVPQTLKATLRPYQSHGLDWLWFCAQSGLGACLADDMGLGKTMQVLAALLRRKAEQPESAPCLLVVPASLLGNWTREAARFAGDLRLHVAHPSADGSSKPHLQGTAAPDVVLTTYGMAAKLAWISEADWGWIILDEAQAIKNPSSRQTRAVKKLHAQARIALTGTPVENSLGDLWSLFDFLNPGLLGSARQFAEFAKKLRESNDGHYGPLRKLVAPYILRRLKTDSSIISDLPDKTEMKVFCGLTAHQARLYEKTAGALSKALEEAEGMERRGLVLAYLMRFKQICNHPDQLNKSGDYVPAQSAKFLRLQAICEEIASRGEKVLIFTQFREMTDPLAAVLAGVFRRGGLILHGGTPVRERQRMVDHFQREDGPPYFVLSLKAGGTGLNLTSASHVVHFDRWWNPAVENQATDRAFRIGQKRNVLVHKFVTSGTLEENIDRLIEEKQDTANAILADGAEKSLTEMTNDELLNFVRLDLKRAESTL